MLNRVHQGISCRMVLRRTTGVVAAALIGAAVLGPGAATASAQRFQMGFGGPGSGGERVSSEDLNKFDSVLGLSKDQAAAAQSLFDAYSAGYDQAQKALREKMDRLREEFQDTRDPSIWQTEMPPAMEKFRGQVAASEKSFFDDLKMLLTPDQAGRWSALERTWRRSKSMNSGMLSGESMDLVRVVDELKIQQPYPDTLSQVLDRYESELDQALTERNDRRAELSKDMPGFGGRPGGGMPDFQAMQNSMTEMRKAGIKVRDLNDRYTSLLQSAVPEAKQADFIDRVRKAKYPQVYREPYVEKALAAAADFKDLTPEERTAIKEMSETYRRERAAANERWARAIGDSEKDGGGDPMLAGFMRMGGEGDAGDDELSVARKARRTLDTQTLDKLRALLTDDQKARLPERETPPGPGGMIFNTGGRR